MKNLLRGLVLIALFNTPALFAMPVLSSDGSKLTGLNVNGTLFDVMFGNGLVEEVYAGIVFDAARSAQAKAVSTALLETFNTMPGGVVGSDIAGCEGDGCRLFVPDAYDLTYGPYENNMTVYTSGVWMDGLGGLIWLEPTDTHDYPQVTLVTYTPQSVPVPATLGLFMLGLAGLGWSTRRSGRNTSHSNCRRKARHPRGPGLTGRTG